MNCLVAGELEAAWCVVESPTLSQVACAWFHGWLSRWSPLWLFLCPMPQRPPLENSASHKGQSELLFFSR